MIERRLVGGEAREAPWASHPGLGFTVRLEDVLRAASRRTEESLQGHGRSREAA